MKILLYTGGRALVEKSGVGKAISHQERALTLRKVEYTENPKEDYDVIHLNTIFPDSWWTAKRARRKGKKVVFHGHSTMEDFRESFVASNLLAPLFRRWLCMCYGTADLVLTPTPYSKKLLLGYGLDVPVEAVSNGIDTEFFSRDEEQRKRFRSTYGLKEEDKVVLSVGLPIERKGILDFIDLAEQMPEVQFFWFGYAPPILLPGRVKKAISRPLPNLHFPGYVAKEELRDAYGGSDLFLFLTHEETEGIVLLEALAMQIPVLVRDIPVYDGWLEDGVHLYKRKKQEEIREMTGKILSKEADDLTAAGLRVAKKRDIRCIGDQLYRFYQSIFEDREEHIRNVFVPEKRRIPGRVI